MVAPNFRARDGYIQTASGDRSLGTSLNEPDSWRYQALCSAPDVDPDDFYNELEWEYVRPLCNRCPVRTDCFEEFLYDPYAFAGGYTPAERRTYVLTGDVPPPPPEPGDRPEPTTVERVLALVALGAGYDFVSRRLGVDGAAAKELARANEVEEPVTVPKRWRGKALSDLARGVLIGLYAGEAPREIGDRLGCHTASVFKIKTRLMYDAA